MRRPDRYGAVAIALHWLIAAGILAQIALGLTMTHAGLSLMRRFEFYQLHKSIGITVLLAVLVRLAWRLGHKPPPLPGAMPAPERAAARGTHLILYALMLGLPLTGWALVSAAAFDLPTVLYGIVPWPHLPVLSTLTNKPPVEAALRWVHDRLGWLILAMAALHIVAALRHAARRDGVFSRILPPPPHRHDRGFKA